MTNLVMLSAQSLMFLRELMVERTTRISSSQAMG
jgi:hypothetical protein